MVKLLIQPLDQANIVKRAMQYCGDDDYYLAREIYGWLCSLSRSESGNPPRAGEGEESARGGDSTLGRSQKSGRHLDTSMICVLRAYEGPRGDGTRCKVL